MYHASVRRVAHHLGWVAGIAYPAVDMGVSEATGFDRQPRRDDHELSRGQASLRIRCVVFGDPGGTRTVVDRLCHGVGPALSACAGCFGEGRGAAVHSAPEVVVGGGHGRPPHRPDEASLNGALANPERRLSLCPSRRLTASGAVVFYDARR